jgi:hypothetical protein
MPSEDVSNAIGRLLRPKKFCKRLRSPGGDDEEMEIDKADVCDGTG